MVTTLSVEAVAMVHCNNCTSELNACAGLFKEFAAAAGFDIDSGALYELLFKKALEGKTVSLVCSGDAGIYGLASLMYEIGQEYDNVELSVIPGITAANSGAAVLGAPLNHDFCTISLSDLLTPWEKIEKRLVAAAEGDFVIALYNPSSHKRKDYLMRACDILLRAIAPDRACGYVENIGREGTSYTVCTLGELRSAQVNMFTTVFIGNEGTQIIDGKLVTRRGYQIE